MTRGAPFNVGDISAEIPPIQKMELKLQNVSSDVKSLE